MFKINDACKIMNEKGSRIILNKNSKVITGTFLGPNARTIRPEDHEKFWIPYGLDQDTVLINGVPYYCKMAEGISLLSEIIGPYLCKKLDLESVDNQIGIDSSATWCCLSKIFYERPYKYDTAKHFLSEFNKEALDYGDVGDFFLQLKMKPLKFSKRMPKLYDDVLKLIAVDLKMGQTDRMDYNLTLKFDSAGECSLAPIYDFGNAYHYEDYFKEYVNPFLVVRNNFLSLAMLFSRCPKLFEYVEYLMEFPMSRILSDIESERNIEINKKSKRWLEKNEEICEKSIRKIKKMF